MKGKRLEKRKRIIFSKITLKNKTKEKEVENRKNG